MKLLSAESFLGERFFSGGEKFIFRGESFNYSGEK